MTQEVSTQQMVSHTNIIQLVDHLSDGIEEGKHWVIMQLATGGELMNRIIKKFSSKMQYTEKEVATIIGDVLRACEHMHKRHIVHCDLKPENILYENEAEDSCLCIADFGFAQLCEREHLTKFRGTLDYMAPELLAMEKKYDAKADVWSVGCLMYVLLSGALPFRRDWGALPPVESDNRVKNLILSGKVDLSSPGWKDVEETTKELLMLMLTKDPEQRPSARECLEHPWFQGGASENQLSILTELKNFNNSRGLLGYSSHSMAGIMSHHASISTLAALGSQGGDLEGRFKEGGIQAALSLGWSDDEAEQVNCLTMLANLAQEAEHQRRIVEEGGVRLICHRVMKILANIAQGTQGVSSNRDTLFFMAALTLNRIANNSNLRQTLADEHVRHDVEDAFQVIPVLVELGVAGLVHKKKRVLNNAACALARLAHDPSLHARIIEAGTLPIIALVADPKNIAQDPFGKTALSALECILRYGAEVQYEGPQTQGSATAELKLRVEALCIAVRGEAALYAKRQKAADSIAFCKEAAAAIDENLRNGERVWPGQVKRREVTKEAVHALWHGLQEQRKSAKISLQYAQNLMVQANAATAVFKSMSGMASATEMDNPIVRTLAELDLRASQYEPLRRAFEEAGISSLVAFASSGLAVEMKSMKD